MFKRLISVVAAGVLALLGLSAVPAQASPGPTHNLTPASSSSPRASRIALHANPLASTDYSCNTPVTFFTYQECATTTVPAGESLWLSVYLSSDVTAGDFNIDDASGTILGVSPTVYAGPGDIMTQVWTNNTGADAFVIVWGSSDGALQSGTMNGAYSVMP
ncbi:hypothetical protein [Amycolatopsis taiwanensis]|nr:hypothetical protein [Amycolatopsis taiwanensis]